MIAMVRDEQIRIGPLALSGDLSVPSRSASLVVFVHGSGSSRFSPRNRRVASVFQAHGLATLLFDLLGDAEADDHEGGVDLALLGGRVVQVLDWAAHHRATSDMRIGLFGASTGAAAALMAAADRPGRVLALVSRGGRPDLALDCLARVEAATLLIVGSGDPQVLDYNRIAFRQLHCVRRLEVLPGATHLFEEPGALESVAELSASWFDAHLPCPRGSI
jgi:putative phosphoribosyl transferase